MDRIESYLSSIYDLLYDIANKFNIYYWLDLENTDFTDEELLVFQDYLENMPKGWVNFWSSFNHMSLKDFILDINNEIENQVNPLSDDNQADFNNVISAINNDTFIGSFNKINDEFIPQIVDSLKGQSATYTFNTASASNSYVSIPAHTITLDMSWYLPYKSYGDMVLSGFMWLSFLWLLFKRAPAIIHGEGMITESLLNFDDRDGEAWEKSTVKESITIDDNGEVKGHTTTQHYTDSSGNDVTIKQVHSRE